MYIWFSESVMNSLLKRFPHMSERKFNNLLAKHEKSITNECGLAAYLNIGKDARWYGLPQSIGLELGDDLKIYYKTERKEKANKYACYVGEEIHCYADGKLVATTKEQTPLLTITVQDKDSIPEITYRGKNYTKLKELNIQWDTMTDKDLGGLSVLIDHFDEDNNVHSCISDKYRGHLTDG